MLGGGLLLANMLLVGLAWLALRGAQRRRDRAVARQLSQGTQRVEHVDAEVNRLGRANEELRQELAELRAACDALPPPVNLHIVDALAERVTALEDWRAAEQERAAVAQRRIEAASVKVGQMAKVGPRGAVSIVASALLPESGGNGA